MSLPSAAGVGSERISGLRGGTPVVRSSRQGRTCGLPRVTRRRSHAEAIRRHTVRTEVRRRGAGLGLHPGEVPESRAGLRERTPRAKQGTLRTFDRNGGDSHEGQGFWSREHRAARVGPSPVSKRGASCHAERNPMAWSGVSTRDDLLSQRRVGRTGCAPSSRRVLLFGTSSQRVERAKAARPKAWWALSSGMQCAPSIDGLTSNLRSQAPPRVTGTPSRALRRCGCRFEGPLVVELASLSSNLGGRYD